MPVEFQDVDSFIELGNSLLLCLKLVDVQLFALEQQVLSLVLGGLSSFQGLEGHESEANQFLSIDFLARDQCQVVDFTKLSKVFGEL